MSTVDKKSPSSPDPEKAPQSGMSSVAEKKKKLHLIWFVRASKTYRKEIPYGRVLFLGSIIISFCLLALFSFAGNYWYALKYQSLREQLQEAKLAYFDSRVRFDKLYENVYSASKEKPAEEEVVREVVLPDKVSPIVDIVNVRPEKDGDTLKIHFGVTNEDGNVRAIGKSWGRLETEDGSVFYHPSWLVENFDTAEDVKGKGFGYFSIARFKEMQMSFDVGDLVPKRITVFYHVNEDPEIYRKTFSLVDEDKG